MVREIAAREHTGPSGRPVRVTRWTLDVWIRTWRQGGFDALAPSPRQSPPRTPPEVMELAAALKEENPARTPAQVQRILRAQSGSAPDETTIRRMFTRTGLTAWSRPRTRRCSAGSRRPGRTRSGPGTRSTRSGCKAAKPTCSLSSTITPWRGDGRPVGVRRGHHPAGRRAAPRAGGSRGIPEHAYVDNGSAFVDAWLLWRLRQAGHQAGPQPAGKARRGGEK